MTYEYRVVPVAPETPREHLRQVLSIHAEYGDWELSGHRIYPGGKRSVTVRRRRRGDHEPPLPS